MQELQKLQLSLTRRILPLRQPPLAHGFSLSQTTPKVLSISWLCLRIHLSSTQKYLGRTFESRHFDWNLFGLCDIILGFTLVTIAPKFYSLGLNAFLLIFHYPPFVLYGDPT